MTVKVAAQALLYDQEAEAGLAGSIYRINPDGGSTYIADTTVRMVDFSSDQMDEVDELKNTEPGRYLIQLTLPDGSIDTKDFKIVDGVESKVLFHIEHRGPHEFTALEEMQGARFVDAADMADPDNGLLIEFDPDAIPSYFDLQEDPEYGYALSLVSGNVPAFSSNRFDVDSLSQLIAGNCSVEDAQHALGDMGALQRATIESDGYIKFEFVHQGLIGDGAQKSAHFFEKGVNIDRHYLMQKTEQGATLICLPTPWMTANEEEAAISLLLDARSVGRAFDYTITVANPLINNVLGYVNAGAIHQAARLIPYKRAEEMLFTKMSRPIEAAIGGYLLLLGQDGDAYRRDSGDWKEWLKNLDIWFDWMPDGAIINAAQFFVMRKGDADKSYEALMRGYKRGLPYFTFGLKLMMDGMRYFVREGDDQAGKCLANLETIARKTDPTKPFLAVNVAQKWDSSTHSEPKKKAVLKPEPKKKVLYAG